MVDANHVDALTQLFIGKKDLVIYQLYPLFSVEFKLTVLPIVNKQIRKSVTVKTRDLQYYNLVASNIFI